MLVKSRCFSSEKQRLFYWHGPFRDSGKKRRADRARGGRRPLFQEEAWPAPPETAFSGSGSPGPAPALLTGYFGPPRQWPAPFFRYTPFFREFPADLEMTGPAPPESPGRDFRSFHTGLPYAGPCRSPFEGRSAPRLKPR